MWPVSLEVRGPDLLHVGEAARVPLVATLRMPQLIARQGRPGKLHATVKVKRKRKLRAGGHSRLLKDYPISQKLNMYVVDAADGIFGVQSELQLPNDNTLITLPECPVLQHSMRASVTIRYGVRKLAKTAFAITVDPGSGGHVGPASPPQPPAQPPAQAPAQPQPQPQPQSQSQLIFFGDAPPSYEEAVGASSSTA